MAIDQTLKLWAQQIALNGDKTISAADALAQAAIERYGDDVQTMAKAFGQLGANALDSLRKQSYELPTQDGLFDVPEWIIISTPEHGPLMIPKDQANIDQVRQYLREGFQHHSVRKGQFARGLKDLERIEDIDPFTPWAKAREILQTRALEAAE